MTPRPYLTMTDRLCPQKSIEISAFLLAITRLGGLVAKWFKLNHAPSDGRIMHTFAEAAWAATITGSKRPNGRGVAQSG